MKQKYNGGIYWLLDSRFDFLLPSFMQEFEIKEQQIIFVNSYHTKARQNRNKIYVFPEKEHCVNLMEPDDINRIFSKSLNLTHRSLVICFSGAGLPQNDNLVSLIATGQIAELCNNKWWQYHFFRGCNIMTPYTYRYHNLNSMKNDFYSLLERYQKIVIKKSCLSGGYNMKVVSSEKELESYCQCLNKKYLDGDFLISEYIPHQQSFASMGIVRKDGEVFSINIVTEQVLYQEVAYEGLIFPPFLGFDNINKIQNTTLKIGEELATKGYYGFYNVDFVLGKDQLYAVEINARLGFCVILAACMYGTNFWKVIQYGNTDDVVYPEKRLVLGKIKGIEGSIYSGL